MQLLLILNSIKTRLANTCNGWSTFFINGKPTFINAPGILPRIPPDCIILDIWVGSVILADESIAKALFSENWLVKIYVGKLGHH